MNKYNMGIGDWGLGIGDWGLGQSPKNIKNQKLFNNHYSLINKSFIFIIK
jgi:hypothetical protein